MDFEPYFPSVKNKELRTCNSYIEHITRVYRQIENDYTRLLLGKSSQEEFELYANILPRGVFEAGYGIGSKELFEDMYSKLINYYTKVGISSSRELLTAFYYLIHIQRLIDDIIACLDRAMVSYKRLISAIRESIIEQASIPPLNRYDGPNKHADIRSITPKAFDISNHAIDIVVALSTSMDITAKLLSFINGTALATGKFNPPPQILANELHKIKPNIFTESELAIVMNKWFSGPVNKEITIFRNDIIHNTTAMDLRRHCYIGIGNAVNGLNLFYSEIFWRDSDTSGVPIRSMGRSYFTSQRIDIDKKLNQWFEYMLESHERISTELSNILRFPIERAGHELIGLQALR